MNIHLYGRNILTIANFFHRFRSSGKYNDSTRIQRWTYLFYVKCHFKLILVNLSVLSRYLTELFFGPSKPLGVFISGLGVPTNTGKRQTWLSSRRSHLHHLSVQLFFHEIKKMRRLCGFQLIWFTGDNCQVFSHIIGDVLTSRRKWNMIRNRLARLINRSLIIPANWSSGRDQMSDKVVVSSEEMSKTKYLSPRGPFWNIRWICSIWWNKQRTRRKN